MQSFSVWPERQAQIVRWILLLGWLLLIASLILRLDPYPFDVNHCGTVSECHFHEGNQIFWGMVVPIGLLILVVGSHELWRRICPLAFVSQVFRALGWQRTTVGKGGRKEVVKVEPDSWLGRHHVQLQWSLLIAGLCLRLLVVNSKTQALGVFLVATIASALVVGWAYGGKAWCQYFCPMAPVQTVVTGPRSFFGTAAHIGAESRITQSMCRTIGENGRIQSACVACQAPCLDIDSERSYWQTLNGKRGLDWAWGSYPGLVIAFFLLIKNESREGIDYLRSGMWAYDIESIHYAWKPLSGIWTLGLPRLITLPLLLVLAASVSAGVFAWLQRIAQARLAPMLGARAGDLATSRTRLLATFVAVNAFFWFVDPSLGMAGWAGGQLIRSLVLIVSGMWLHRGWHRDRDLYTRESTSGSLRKQLEKLIPDLSPYLEGRTLAELSPGEVFTLAKVLPIHIQQTKRSLYKNVVADLLGTGRLDRTSSLVQLQELRHSLELVEEDHFATIRELAIQDPRILELDDLQRERRNLRQEAAAEAIEELMALRRTADLGELLRQPLLRERLEEIRARFALDEISWQELLAGFGPSSGHARRWLEGELDTLDHQLACRRVLAQGGSGEPLLRPLLPVIERRILSHGAMIAPALQAFAAEDPLIARVEALRPHCPLPVQGLIRRRDHAGAPSPCGSAPGEPGPEPPLADVLDELWLDPDPDTALWVLRVQLQLHPERGERLRRTPRLGLPGSASLDRLLQGEVIEAAELIERLLELPLVAGLPPAALFALARGGERRCWEPGEALFRRGDPTDFVAILLEGSCEVLGPGGGRSEGEEGAVPIATVLPGEPIGEVSFLTDGPRQVSIRSGSQPVVALVYSATQFENLLHQCSAFNRRLLHQLALKLEGLYASGAPVPIRGGATVPPTPRQDGPLSKAA